MTDGLEKVILCCVVSVELFSNCELKVTVLGTCGDVYDCWIMYWCFTGDCEFHFS